MSGFPPRAREPRKRDWAWDVWFPGFWIVVVLLGGMHDSLSWILLAIYSLWFGIGWHRHWRARDAWREWRKQSGLAEKD